MPGGGAPSAERHEDEAHARKTLKKIPSKCAPCPALSHLPPGHRQGASGLWHNRVRLCKRCCNVKNWHSTGAEALAVPEAAPQSRKQRLRVPRKDAVSFNPEAPNLLSECSPMRRASWWTHLTEKSAKSSSIADFPAATSRGNTFQHLSAQEDCVWRCGPSCPNVPSALWHSAPSGASHRQGAHQP